MRIHCIAFTVEASKQSFEICKDEDGDLSDTRAIRRHSGEILIPSRLMNYVMILYKEYHSSTMWIEHEIKNLLQKLDWWQIKKDHEEEDKQFSSQLLPAKQKQLQISRNRGRRSIKFIEELSKMQSTVFTCPRRRNEFWQTAFMPSLRTSPC